MIQEIIQTYERPLYRSFCVPEVSKKLMKAGLTELTVFCWVVKNNEAHLQTFAFDTDNYYANAMKLLHEIQPPDTVLPAYSISDLMAALGNNVAIVKEETGFTVGITEDAAPYEFIITQYAPRLPDALGLLLENCLIDKYIMPGKELDNKIIHTETPFL